MTGEDETGAGGEGGTEEVPGTEYLHQLLEVVALLRPGLLVRVDRGLQRTLRPLVTVSLAGPARWGCVRPPSLWSEWVVPTVRYPTSDEVPKSPVPEFLL